MRIVCVDRSFMCRALTASVAAVAMMLCFSLQATLEAATSQRLDVVTVASGLAVTLAFRPLERWLRTMVDRWRPRRRQLTLLFTDIVGSTELLVSLGDERWHACLREYRASIRRELKRFGGHEVDTAGDGFFATFESPASAVRCAQAIAAGMPTLGLRVRVGLHIGPCTDSAEKVSGLNVHAAARVMAIARPGEVLVSDALRAALDGIPVALVARGSHVLKGVPGEWPLYAMAWGT